MQHSLRTPAARAAQAATPAGALAFSRWMLAANNVHANKHLIQHRKANNKNNNLEGNSNES